MTCEVEARTEAVIGKMLRTARRMGATARRAQRDLGCENPMLLVGVGLRAVFGAPDERVPADMAALLDQLDRSN